MSDADRTKLCERADALVVAAVDALPGIGVIVFDDAQRIVAARGAAFKPGAVTRIVPGLTLQEALGPELWADSGPLYERVLQGERLARRREAAGGVYDLTASPVRIDGRIAGGIIVTIDVTEQCRAERALAEGRRPSRDDELRDGQAQWSPDGVCLWASPSMEVLTAAAPGELSGTPIDRLLHPDDLALWRGRLKELRRTRDPLRIEVRVRCGDERWRWVELSATGAFERRTGALMSLSTTLRDIAQRRDDDDARRVADLTFRFTTRGISVSDPVTGELRSVNAAFATMHGGVVGDFVGRPLSSVVAPASAGRLPDLAEPLERDGFAGYEAEHVRLDGTCFPVATEVIAARDGDGRLLYRLSYYTDVSERDRIERARRAALAQFERAFSDAPIGMALVGLDGRFLRVNRALHEMLGYTEEQLVARTFQEVTHADDVDADVAEVQRLLRGDGDGYSMEKRYIAADATSVWALLSVSLLRDDDGVPLHFVSQIVDISERKRVEERLHHLADHDSLTGLWNRRRFEDELQRQVARCRRYGEHAGLLILDLDEFKAVNDTYGHAVGDALLAHVARLLRARMRTTDCVARIGGDEFAVLLANATRVSADATAAQLAALLGERSLVLDDGVILPAGASVGVAMLENESADGEAALVAADFAMYAAKAGSRGDAGARAGAARGHAGADR